MLEPPQRYIDQLSTALTRRDLQVQVNGRFVTAKTPLPLSQDVLLREADEGWTWCWVWYRPRPADRDAPAPEPEIEPFCAAGDVDKAVRLIAKVLSGRAEESANA